jgi:hypothetical protein
MRVGIGTMPLDWGRCPRWLFERMKRLARAISLVIVEEFGPEEFLKRISDVVWLQSFGNVLGWDWNSSGLGIVTLAALKEGLKGIEKEIGIFVCGGKKVSRKTPEEIQRWGEILGWPQEKVNELIYSSKIAAKVDSALIQDGFTLYAHNFIFSKKGYWCIVQQGLNINIQKARRYHWLSSNVKDFTEEPHSGIVSDIKVRPLNLVAKESRENKEISVELVREEPKTFLKDIRLISEKASPLMKQKRLPGFCEMELENVEFYHHPVEKEKFDLKRLKKTIEKAHFLKPENFEQLLMTEGVGPKTIRALSLVSEIIYGAKPSYEDPARYSFAHGGKDSVPYSIDRITYDETISVLEKGIEMAKISLKEKERAKERLWLESKRLLWKF